MLPFLLTLAWSVFLNNPIVTADETLPALGPFLSPFTGFWHNAYLDEQPPIYHYHLSVDQIPP